MSKGNMLLGYARGKVGSMVFARRAGEQITRPYNGNPKNPRTLAQMRRRIKWANLINSWRLFKPWIQMGMQSKKTTQSDYNKFVSLNLNQSLAYLLKEEAAAGGVILADYILTSGTLGLRAMQSAAITSIKLAETTDFARMTIGQLSSDILSRNLGFAIGDQITVLGFGQRLEAGLPVVDVCGFKFLLTDAADARMAGTAIEKFGPISPTVSDGNLSFDFVGIEYATYGGAVIQSRLSSDGNLQLSDSKILAFYSAGGAQMATNPFSTSATEALNSYGYDPDVFLSPKTSSPIVSSVLIDGSAIDNNGAIQLPADEPVLVQVAGRGFDVNTPVVTYGGNSVQLTTVTPTTATFSVTPEESNRPIVITVGAFVYTVNVTGTKL